MVRVTVWYVQNNDGTWSHNHIQDGWAIELDRPHSELDNLKDRHYQDGVWAKQKWKAVYAFKTDSGLVSEKAACIASIKMSGAYNYVPSDMLIKALEAKK